MQTINYSSRTYSSVSDRLLESFTAVVESWTTFCDRKLRHVTSSELGSQLNTKLISEAILICTSPSFSELVARLVLEFMSVGIGACVLRNVPGSSPELPGTFYQYH